MKINWSVRFNNPHWWAQIALSVGVPVLAYFGVSASDLTTWDAVFDVFIKAIKNPVVFVSALTAIFNALVDPTTKGLSDSVTAMTFRKPN